MQSSTYVSRRPGPFAALIQTTALGGYRLSPLAPVRVRDQYWDTADGELLRSGLSLRVREQDGARTAALRPVQPDPTAAHVPDAALGPEDGAPALFLPPGPLADALAARLGADTLRPLLALRQYRTPRVAYDGARPALLVSLDVVVYEVPGAQVVSNEVEVEITAQGEEADVATIDPALRTFSLDPEPRTKLERGLMRLTRDLAEPVLLLPDERAEAERLAERGDPAVQRRARVLLLDARGYRADTVAAQTGLSAARVRFWKEQFGARRMAIFGPDTLTDVSADGSGASSDVVGDRAPEPLRPVAAAFEGARAEAPPAEAPPAEAPPAEAPPAEAPPAEAPPAEAPAAEPSASEAPEVSAAPHYRVSELIEPPAAGDGALEENLDDDDLDGLLEQFSPADTETPILDTDDDDDDAPAPLDGTEPERPATAARDASEPGEARQPEPTVSAPEASAGAQNDAAATETAHGSPPTARRAPPAGLRAPALAAETPLVDAAFATLVYHVARFEDAADRLRDADRPDDARRVLICAHRVRLAVEAFAPFVPAMAAGRLVAALRPLVGALDAALDRDAAGQDATDARADARRLLGGGRHRAWGPRAHRLLERLGAQHAGGLLIGDDFPAPPDDLVGLPGDVPAAARLRHAGASMLWARYEALRAFEDDVDMPETAEGVYHLTLAVSALHFVLGIVATATTGDARLLAGRLDAAEARLGARRQALRTAELTGTPAEASPVVGEVWADLTSPDLRQCLADVAAGI